MPDILEDEWAGYRDKVVPKSAGRTQLLETRQAFYAGALSCLTVMCSAAVHESADRTIERLQRELEMVMAPGRRGKP